MDALAVRVVERRGHLAGQLDGLFDAQLRFAVELPPERLALDVGHDVEQQPVGLARVVQRQDVGVGELGRDADLTQEPLGAERGRELGAQHFECHQAIMSEIAREIDHRHPATTQLTLDRVTVG
jgi:hypothetical protein